MLDPRNIADLEKVNGRWRLSFFIASQPAFMYDGHEGKRGILYAIQCQDYCKMGMTTDLNKRFKAIESGTPFDVSLIGKKTVQLAGLAYAEAWIHKQFAKQWAKNEWFRVTPEQAIGKLQEASIVALLYSRMCREWFFEDRKRKANDPEYQERMKQEYAKFLSTYKKRMREPDLQSNSFL